MAYPDSGEFRVETIMKTNKGFERRLPGLQSTPPFIKEYFQKKFDPRYPVRHKHKPWVRTVLKFFAVLAVSSGGSD